MGHNRIAITVITVEYGCVSLRMRFFPQNFGTIKRILPGSSSPPHREGPETEVAKNHATNKMATGRHVYSNDAWQSDCRLEEEMKVGLYYTSNCCNSTLINLKLMSHSCASSS